MNPSSSFVRRTLAVLTSLLMIGTMSAQTELGSDSGPSSSWALLSIQRTWTPPGNTPNFGFGFQGFSALDEDRRWWMGLGLMGSGIGRRDLLAIVGGPSWFFIGDGRLGGFAFTQVGLAMTSNSGLTGFNFFTDQTLVFGAASMNGVGMTMELFTNLRLQLAVVANIYTVDGGKTPFGLQFGLSSGGR